jgi:hypothetical protein
MRSEEVESARDRKGRRSGHKANGKKKGGIRSEILRFSLFLSFLSIFFSSTPVEITAHIEPRLSYVEKFS